MMKGQYVAIILMFAIVMALMFLIGIILKEGF